MCLAQNEDFVIAKVTTLSCLPHRGCHNLVAVSIRAAGKTIAFERVCEVGAGKPQTLSFEIAVFEVSTHFFSFSERHAIETHAVRQLIIDGCESKSGREQPWGGEKPADKAVDRVDVVWVIQQPPSHLSVPKSVLDFVTRNIRVGEDADASGAARPFTRENGELSDDHRCFSAPGAGRDIQCLT
ncbi:hypothetical protein PSEUDO9AZ_20037 [Pseudomonas sp. 9AZ]|nr:hypothetical protein PSEUDO9AZ_20037 [Pseudomonas sp. 9AZ]